MRLKRLIAPIVVSCITAIAVLLTNTHKTISPIPDNATTMVLGIFAQEKDPLVLKKRVQDLVGNQWKNYSVYVVDLRSSFTMGINESEVFTAASVNKLPILATLYHEADGGTVDFDKTITLQTEDIQDYGTGSIRYDAPGSTYSVKTLARLMTQKSDNTAAHLLGNYVVSLPLVQSTIESWGLSQTDMVNNKTSNRDMATLLTKMYAQKLTSPALTPEMLGFLKDSDFETRLPDKLPRGITVYHKVGTGEGQVHDVGIVTNGQTVYYIGVFTDNVGEEDQASALLSKISKTVYDFMR